MRHAILAPAFALIATAHPAPALDLVRDGKPVAVIVISAEGAGGAENAENGVPEPGKARGRRPRKAQGVDGLPGSDRPGPDGFAAGLLVDWVRRMTGAELPVVTEAPADGPAVLVGRAAVRAGLDVADPASPSREGIRIRTDGNRLLVAGGRPAATAKAVCRLLEEFGCRVFMDGPIGEIAPRRTDLVIDKLDIAGRPGFLMRNPKGPSWAGFSLWKLWNGAGGEEMGHAHSWGRYVQESLFTEHPDWFALRADGKRAPSGWLCTSNPELREYFAGRVIEAIRAGAKHPSLSPTDGTGYCKCPACAAQDDPASLEPSSGRVSMTNRYVDFFSAVARKVGAVFPDSILSFYVYADYTQPPTRKEKLPPNLCAFVAPIRYCRLHAIGSPRCPSRLQQKEMMDAWSAVASRLGYYQYSYDLAEATVPVPRLSAIRTEIPYLKAKGCAGLTMEMLTNWHIYGPSMHLALRLAYDPAADADAVLEDYYAKFYGSKAAPFMKKYWTEIDEAFAALDCHAGGFASTPLVYTSDFLARLKKHLDAAAEAAKDDPACADRVALHTEGWRSAEEYRSLLDAVNAGDFARANGILAAFRTRMAEVVRKGWANREYGTAYLDRFVAKIVEAGARTAAPPNRVVAVLPDAWRMAYDDDGTGAAKGFGGEAFDDSGWASVSTYEKPLSAQGYPDRLAVMWYRTSFEVPETAKGKLSLFFAQVDGLCEVTVNRKPVPLLPPPPPPSPPSGAADAAKRKRERQAKKTGAAPDSQKRETGAAPVSPAAAAYPLSSATLRTPFMVDISGAVWPGRNVVAVRVDHTRLTELFLGGIVRPVYLIERPE